LKLAHGGREHPDEDSSIHVVLVVLEFLEVEEFWCNVVVLVVLG
jgi:hypothetical protein